MDENGEKRHLFIVCPIPIPIPISIDSAVATFDSLHFQINSREEEKKHTHTNK